MFYISQNKQIEILRSNINELNEENKRLKKEVEFLKYQIIQKVALEQSKLLKVQEIVEKLGGSFIKVSEKLPSITDHERDKLGKDYVLNTVRIEFESPTFIYKESADEFIQGLNEILKF